MMTLSEIADWIRPVLESYRKSGVYTETLNEHYVDLQFALVLITGEDEKGQTLGYTLHPRVVAFGTESLYPEGVLESLIFYGLLLERPPGVQK